MQALWKYKVDMKLNCVFSKEAQGKLWLAAPALALLLCPEFFVTN
jgi:hypothetical protein